MTPTVRGGRVLPGREQFGEQAPLPIPSTTRAGDECAAINGKRGHPRGQLRQPARPDRGALVEQAL
ncbi:MAG: hypothetical protein L0I24_14075 [Pseudonocardia sp.]|nr:hypothetical protein [Pseudonocardia sp.]